MGNALGRKRSVKVMKVDGETMKLKTPVRAGFVVLNHPGHILLESEAVRQYGTQAKPLGPLQELKPNRLYFLVQLPEEKNPRIRRMRSANHTSAKDRLESLMLSRRSASDISTRKTPVNVQNLQETGGGVRVRMRLPKAEVERLLSESNDSAEVAEKIAGLCRAAGGEEKVDKQAPINHQKRVGFLSLSEAESIHLAMAS